jgi:hypothetical protein
MFEVRVNHAPGVSDRVISRDERVSSAAVLAESFFSKNLVWRVRVTTPSGRVATDFSDKAKAIECDWQRSI